MNRTPRQKINNNKYDSATTVSLVEISISTGNS